MAEGYIFNTLQGKVEVFGKTGPLKLLYLKTANKRYVLEGNLVEEINKIKQFDVLITGKISGRLLTPIAYDVVFNKDVLEADEGLFIGELFCEGQEMYLITQDLYVLRVYADSLGYYNGRKMLLRGRYVKTGDYTGEINVVNFIDLSE